MHRHEKALHFHNFLFRGICVSGDIVSAVCGFPGVNLARYRAMSDGCCVKSGPAFVAFRTRRQIVAATEVPC